jgi:hypothetical protein
MPSPLHGAKPKAWFLRPVTGEIKAVKLRTGSLSDMAIFHRPLIDA